VRISEEDATDNKKTRSSCLRRTILATIAHSQMCCGRQAGGGELYLDNFSRHLILRLYLSRIRVRMEQNIQSDSGMWIPGTTSLEGKQSDPKNARGIRNIVGVSRRLPLFLKDLSHMEDSHGPTRMGMINVCR
jgi:hypothetical protein